MKKAKRAKVKTRDLKSVKDPRGGACKTPPPGGPTPTPYPNTN